MKNTKIIIVGIVLMFATNFMIGWFANDVFRHCADLLQKASQCEQTDCMEQAATAANIEKYKLPAVTK